MVAALLMAEAGCMSMAAESRAPMAACDAGMVQDLIGRRATAELGREALRQSGARALRWIRPGQAITMDFSPDRLNVEVDGQDRVAALRCG